MLRYLLFVVAVSVAAVFYGPQAMTGLVGAVPDENRSEAGTRRGSDRAVAAPRTSRTTARNAAPRQTSHGRKVRLKRGPMGHYRADVKVNGRKLRMMVDTGASLIALTAKDARRLGVYPRRDQFIYETKTANGTARVAVVELDVVKIGSIRVENVRATVHKGRGLDVNLLGMSFLNRLRKFNFEDDTLTMVN